MSTWCQGSFVFIREKCNVRSLCYMFAVGRGVIVKRLEHEASWISAIYSKCQHWQWLYRTRYAADKALLRGFWDGHTVNDQAFISHLNMMRNMSKLAQLSYKRA